MTNIRIVPQAHEFVIELLGKYKTTWSAGIHVKIPVIERISKRVTLKEQVLDSPPQPVITKDNVTMQIDSVVFFQVVDPKLYSYGIERPIAAIENLTATTLRNIVGELELDQTLTSRDTVNTKMREIIDTATDPWGIKVTRYEIKNITPPQSIRDAMEKQMRAEREKRAMIAESEGERQSKINRAEGERQEAIALSEGERTRRINEAEGKAKEILLVAEAQAAGISKVAEALSGKGGIESVNMQLAQQYLKEFGNLAKTNNTMIIPSNLADVAGVIKSCASVIKEIK
jgi:regulator of protease activity HflC (stomatin/prohibitin superfamily)